jgi:hypothetical protein
VRDKQGDESGKMTSAALCEPPCRGTG